MFSEDPFSYQVEKKIGYMDMDTKGEAESPAKKTFFQFKWGNVVA